MKHFIHFVSYFLIWPLLFASSALTLNEPILVHEPYWEDKTLEDYAKRILKTINPYMIVENDVDRANKRITYQGEQIKVRRVTEFGRVLPNIFLRQVLAKIKDPKRAVPRIFLLPKPDVPVSFEFLLPYRKMSCNAAHNCIQVLSDSFEIFQEYIEGKGEVGDGSFFPFGHFDFNAEQIVTNVRDGKKYLIDTKEQKNFFLPQLSPGKDTFTAYWLYNIGREVPQNPSSFERWKRQQTAKMIEDAENNFGPGQKSIKVSLGEFSRIDLMRIHAIDYASQVFDDDTHGERYFTNLKDNVARYLFLGRADLLQKLFDEHPDFAIDNIRVPFLEGTRIIGLNPVQYIFRSKSFSNVEKEHLLKLFLREPDYFANQEAHNDVNKWPLYLALGTGSEDIFNLVLSAGVDINALVASNSILHHAMVKLGQGANDDILSIVKIILPMSNQANIKAVLLLLLQKDDMPKSVFRDVAKETRISLANQLMEHLEFIDAELIEKIFSYGEHSVIEKILEKRFDFEDMLITAMILVKDQSHDYIRWAQGDNSPVDYYWYELVEKILALKGSYAGQADSAIDKAISHALANSKVQILCVLLKHLPAHAPYMKKQINEIKNSSYTPASLLEAAIKGRCALLIQLLVTNGIPINVTHIREALGRRDNSDVIDALLLSPTINLQSGLRESVDYKNLYAAEKFLRAIHDKGDVPSSENYKYIYLSPLEELKTIAKKLAASGVHKMSRWDVADIVGKGDLKTLNYLVTHNIDVGQVLIGSVRHIVFAKQNKVTIGYEWFTLLNNISAKEDLEPMAIDEAISIALRNSRTDIVRIFVRHLEKIPNIPKEEQRTRTTIKANLRDGYVRNKYYCEAKSLSQVLANIYIEEGMPADTQCW